jgi:hypothetical protein
VSSPLPHLIIGNPQNRRVAMFVEALERLGHPPPLVFSHLDLLAAPQRLLEIVDSPHLVRIDSAGEDGNVERGLLRLGHQAALAEGVSTIAPEALAELQLERGQVIAPRQRHLGFCVYLERLAEVFAQRPSWRVLSPLASIAMLFDKRRCSRLYRQHGIATPHVLDDVTDVDDLRAKMQAAGIERVFVKLASASSASCLAYFSRTRGKERVMTTMRRTAHGLFNSLKLQSLSRPHAIDEALGFLLSEGSQVERAEPKARLDRAFFDCRVLTVQNEPSFLVVRQSHHIITNLHLGGFRGDAAKLRATLGEKPYEAAMQSCRRVAELHGCFQLGIDVMFAPDMSQHRIIEANAFGDLLPGLERDGLDVYAYQAQKAADSLCPQ